MFHGLRMCDRNVARHSFPAPVKGEGIGRVVRAGAWVVMIPSSCVVCRVSCLGSWGEASASDSG